MKITQKLVTEVKRSNRLSLHPQSWHDFQGLREVEAINWAIDKLAGTQPTLADIVSEATDFIEATNWR